MSADGLFASSRRHGVTVYIVLCLVWAGTVTAVIQQQGYLNAAAILGVPANERLFGDMRIVADGIEASALGQDVIGSTYKPRDYFAIQFPYPRAWLLAAHLGVRSAHTEVLAVALGVGLLAHIAVLIAASGNRAVAGLVMAAFACSPPVMLALERGNPDLFLYLLLAGACHVMVQPWWPAQLAGAALLFAGGALKFFPFAGVPGLVFGDRRERRWRLAAVFISAAVVFMIVERGDVVRIATSPLAGSDWASFGSAVSAATLARVATRVTGGEWPAWVVAATRAVGVTLLVAVAWIYGRALARTAANGPGDLVTASFATAAGMFTGSFILMRSYNYKFIFLAMAIPALCHWSRAGDDRGLTARCALATLLLWLWSGLNGYLYLGMNIFAAWVFAACIASLLVSLLVRQMATAWPDAIHDASARCLPVPP